MENIFKIIAFLEGWSYILLLFIAVPIKYLLENEFYVQILGMPHGVLFLIYILLAFMLKSKFKWENKIFSYILLASIIPFGTFYITKKYF